ncbi:MAG: response regulator [Candidatus Aureabacteria bacterium]|nr:response regulator [Candidatus Auribacterota bacterium]
MNKKILLVEDDNCLRESLTMVLQENDFEVVNIADGKGALKSLQQNKFDAIILDDNLPFIQGQDLLGLIRIQNPSVKIILMSGLFKPDDINNIKKKGADFIMEKPFEPDVIINILRKMDE